MIKFDDNLILKILNQLSEVYPRMIMHDGLILQDHTDREEIKKHLAYIHGDCFIDLDEDFMSDGSLILKGIRITNKGIRYLLEQSD